MLQKKKICIWRLSVFLQKPKEIHDPKAYKLYLCVSQTLAPTFSLYPFILEFTLYFYIYFCYFNFCVFVCISAGQKVSDPVVTTYR